MIVFAIEKGGLGRPNPGYLRTEELIIVIIMAEMAKLAEMVKTSQWKALTIPTGR